MPHTTEQHRQEVIDTYVAADRARLYGLLAAAYGAVAMLAVLGAIIIGWIDVWDGVLAVAGAFLLSMVPAAKFYSDAVRTTVAAAALERQLGSETDDLFESTLDHRRHVRIVGIVGLALAAIMAVGIAGYSVQNADTRMPGDVDNDELVDDDDGDDQGDDDGPGDDSEESPEGGGDDSGESPEGGGEQDGSGDD